MDKQYLQKIIDYSLSKEITSLDDLNITNGLSGVILLLIKHYQVENCDFLIDSLTILSERINKNFSKFEISIDFFSGHLGIAYTFALLSTIIDEARNKKISEFILGQLDFNKQLPTSDLFGGYAGVLLGLMKYNEIYKHNIELDSLFTNMYSKALFDYSSNGISFDKRPYQLREFCGMAHGVSGISYVLAIYNKNSSDLNIYEIIRKCLKYENHYLKTCKLWPDFRVFPQLRVKEIVSRYFKARKKEVSSHGSWCNGFSGIGINRIYLYKIFGDQELLQDINLVRISISSFIFKQRNLSLCCGLGSMMLFLLVDTLVLKNIQSKALLDKIFDSQFFNKYLELCSDYSLFYGMSGIYYIYLYYKKGELDDNFLFFDNPTLQYKCRSVNIEELLIQLKYPDLYSRIKNELSPDLNISIKSFFNLVKNTDSFILDFNIGKKRNLLLKKASYYNIEIYCEEILCKYLAGIIQKEGFGKSITKIELEINDKMFVNEDFQSVKLEVFNVYYSKKFDISNQLFRIINLFNNGLTLGEFISTTQINEKSLISSFINNQILIPKKNSSNRAIISKLFKKKYGTQIT